MIQCTSEQNFAVNGDHRILEHEHIKRLIRDFYERNPDIPKPKTLYLFYSWDHIRDKPHLTEFDCVYVMGGLLEVDLDLGRAVVLNCGGCRHARLACGRFHAEGGGSPFRPTTRLGDHYSRSKPNDHRFIPEEEFYLRGSSDERYRRRRANDERTPPHADPKPEHASEECGPIAGHALFLAMIGARHTSTPELPSLPELPSPYRNLKPEHAAGMAASVIAAILFLVMIGAGIASMVGTFYRDAGW